MPGIDELSRVIGNLEASIGTLFKKNETLCREVKLLNVDMQDKIKGLAASLQKRKLWDTIKIMTGAFLGGAAAVIAKLTLWGD
jgi:phage-related tail protein